MVKAKLLFNARFLLLMLPMMCAGNVLAHTNSTSYLHILPQANGLQTEWKIPLSDLDRRLNLDTNQDDRISVAEVNGSRDRITRYVMSTLIIEQHALPCHTLGDHFQLDTIDTRPAVVLNFRIACKKSVNSAQPLDLQYRLFLRENPWHQGIVSIENSGGINRHVLTSDKNSLSISPQSTVQPSWSAFLMEGIWHIFIGLDHILFLLTLVLPVVFHRTPLLNMDSGKAPFLLKPIISVVTAFTLAHSVTLLLSAMDILSLPTQLIETGIAVSVVIGAALALFPAFERWRWLLAMSFGLIHGFGFANVLAELITPGESLVLDLVAFNIGVELGQISIVMLVVPLTLLLARLTQLPQRMFLPSMIIIMGFGILWFLQRGLGFSLPMMV